MKRRNIIYGSLITALGIFAFIYAGRYASTVNLGSGSTGGDFFPRIMSAGLVVTGIVIVIGAVLSKEGEKAEPIKWISLLIHLASFALYYVLLKPLGFIVDSIWITAFIMYRFGCRNYVALAVWSILMPTVIFCVFYYLLYVGLPLGILEPILPKY